MNILGISSYLHNASAALIVNGQLLSAVEEERLNKEKYTNAFPYNSINFCLRQNNMTFDDIDAISIGWNPYLELFQSVKHFVRYFPNTLNIIRSNSTDAPILPRLKRIVFLENELKRHFSLKKCPPIHYVQHHLAHAANAYYESGYSHAAILVMDGLGDNYDSVTVWRASKSSIKKVLSIKFPHSIGILYYCIQAYLGFPDNSGAGKVMGLSSYGDKSYEYHFDNLVRLGNNGTFKLDLSMLRYHLYGNNQPYSRNFIKQYGEPRNIYDDIDPSHENTAYALQKLTERIVLHVCKYIYDSIGEDNLCISGGVGLNCVANGVLAEHKIFKNIFVSNAPHDAGTSIGAGYWTSHLYGIDNLQNKCGAYTGPEYTDEEVASILESLSDGTRFGYIRVDNPGKIAAERIYNGEIVGWFQGRLEFGPRALGNRSILADPRDPNMKELLNQKVKFREGFRPFAPSVMIEYASEYFNPVNTSPYMSFVSHVNIDKRDEIPAVTHVDGTARVQTVQREQNRLYYELIEEFKNLTGVPLVLNTSLNIKGMPICASPEDAVNCFLFSEMDCLIIGHYYVWKLK